ncbi:MAG TPA: 50S ribosomal protein L11 methyltransferase [Acidobacteriota bacterium]|nr:50S ribosomal protein L11 methyltransferase [Acidobacteriota bacterium]
MRHRAILADSEEIESHALALAESCDLVIDHTDTFRGRGLFRPFVRLLLENCGARVVGADARACFLADNKAAAKSRLAEAGIPVPPGIIIHSETWELPPWLKPPLVLKPVFEHMSRGIRVVQSEQEARVAASQLLGSLRQPVLAESFIPGRELAISLLSGPEGLQVLPPLEWNVSAGDAQILSEEFKLVDPDKADRGIARPALSPKLQKEIEDLARLAFHVLGLRDYGRFDLRLSPNETPYFLEANTTPSLEPLEALAISAGWAGLEYSALVDRMLCAATRRNTPPQMGKNLLRVPHVSGTIELETTDSVSAPPQSTIELAQMLDIQPGERVLELGCGSGLLSIVAAKLGASCVTATDLDPNALGAASRNALRNGVAERIQLHAGSWYEALRGAISPDGTEESFDLIIATPPQTPAPAPFGPKYGGAEGTDNLLKILQGASAYLNRDRGRLWLMAISLANPDELWTCLKKYFAEVSVIRETDRAFSAGEYEALREGLFDYLCRLRSAGKSRFTDAGNGRYVFRNIFIRAAKPRVP